MRRIAVILLVLCSFSVFAAGPVAGSLHWQSGGVVPIGPRTYLDTNHPVSADGTIDTLVTRWLTDLDCSDEIKVRFFRMGTTGITGPLTLVGTAGPFAAKNGLNILTFPPVEVQKGDLLAISQLKPGCGGVTFTEGRAEDVVYEINGDFEGGLLSSAGVFARQRYSLSAIASNGPQLVGLLPVVGSAPGNFGSFFRTGLSITNTSPYPATITLVFHPAGVSASPNDPYLNILLAGWATKNYTDVVQAMSQSGLGSLEIFSNAYTPTVAARIFNDAGAAGTSGFTEETVLVGDGFGEGEYAYVPLPVDTTNYRLNIGVRTFAETRISCAFYDADGKYSGAGPSKTYPANYFEQVSLAQFSGNFATPAGGVMLVAIESGGPAVLYSATTDNRTNDGSLKMFTLK